MMWDFMETCHREKSLRPLRPLFIAGLVVAASLALVTTATAQDFNDLRTPRSPLVLKAQGSFFVGGEIVFRDGLLGEPIDHPVPLSGKMAVNQMYVQYMIPSGKVKVPVVMVHGGTLTGKSYETTPDGRMGWDEYFVRNGHAVYVADQVNRGRSGFDQSQINIVRSGIASPSTLPNILRLDTDYSWVAFGFGPEPGVPFPDTQFPVEAADEFAKQGVPDFNHGIPTSVEKVNEQLTTKAMSDLAVKLKGAVLMGHSQSNRYPMLAALLNPGAVKATVALDACPDGFFDGADLTDAQLSTLVDVPMLGVASGRNPASICDDFINRFTALGGKAQLIFPPDFGIHGNTHMMMLDKNNQQIADLIMKWIDKNVGKKRGKHHGHGDRHHSTRRH